MVLKISPSISSGILPLVAVDKICVNDVSVIVTVNIFYTQDQISAMMGNCGKYGFVLSEQKDTRQGNTAFPRFKVHLVQLRTF